MVISLATMLLPDGHTIAEPSIGGITVCCVTSISFKKKFFSREHVMIFSEYVRTISASDCAVAHAIVEKATSL